jgi:hypothetical protein
VALLVGVIGLLPASEPERGKVPDAKRFTLRENRVSLSKALDALARQTGVRVEDKRGEPDAIIAVNADRATFWQAFDAIADAAGAVPFLSVKGEPLALVKRPEGYVKPPICYDNLFRLSIKRTSATRDLESNRANCTLTFEVAWLPDLLPLFLETKPQNLRMLDDRNAPVPLTDEGSVQAEVDGRTSFTFDVNVPALPRSASRIGLLEGKLSAVAPNKMLTFTFDTLAELKKVGAASPKRRLMQDGAACRVDKLTLVKDRWTVRIALDLAPGGKKLESFQANSWVVNNELALVHADGKRRLLPSSFVLESATAKRAILSYHFVDKGLAKRGRPQDWKIVYRTPAMIVDVPIAFRFTNVPLP